MQSKLLLDNYIKVSDKINVAVPTVGEVYRNENLYSLITYHLTAMPFTRKAELWLMKIDYITISFYDLFVQALYEIYILSCGSKEQIYKMFGMEQEASPAFSNLFFKDLDFNTMEIRKLDDGHFVVYFGEEEVFNQEMMDKTAEVFRRIIGEKKDNRKEDIGGASGRYVLERSVKVLKRQMAKAKKHPHQYSMLETYITMLVNNSDFKYDYESVMNISYVKFILSLRQVLQNRHVDHIAYGIYSGNVSTKELTNKDKSYFYLDEQ